jgi:isocitrate/isopropylmalate dehydrogenase
LTHDIALIPGDGIANEVVAEARRVLEQAGEIWDFDFEWTEYKYRREVREYGETVVVDHICRSLLREITDSTAHFQG